MMKCFKIIVFFFCSILCVSQSFSQIVNGKITFERKTNLYKLFEKTWKTVRDDIKEADSKKIDFFELYFNDTCALFLPQESLVKEKLSWATSKNIFYSKYNENKYLYVKTAWSEQLYIEDKLKKHTWKITDSKRNIAGFNCTKAFTTIHDSVKIYAWFTPDIVPTIGPESMQGLPGAILGLATEDGGIIYMATKVESGLAKFEDKIPSTKRKKIYTNDELKAYMKSEFNDNRWAKQMLKTLFFW